MAEPDAFSTNILAVSDLVGSGTNKVSGSGTEGEEGASGARIDVLDLPMEDEELLALRDEWEGEYASYEGKISKIPERNLRSYLGRMSNGQVPGEDEVVAANLQFESEETFLPAATAQDPAPFVFADNSPEGNKVSQDVQTMLQFHAQQLLLRRKMAVMVRQWSIHHLAALKPGWNEAINDVAIENRKIQNFIFDPNGYVDVYGDFVGHLGERIYVTANELIGLFPEHKAYIELEVTGEDGSPKLGTEVCYTEWWNDDYCFTTFKEKVLDKHKNQYFLYPEPIEGDFEDESGEKAMTDPRNHFAIPKKPYIFLSVFSLQEHPHDMTGLIEQNIPNQSLITRRTVQIDENLSQSNNGIAFSENNFNQETARGAADALMKGVGKVLVPSGGPISEAIVRIAAPELPNGFFDDLENSKNNLRSSWGTQGIASQQQKPDETARGMVLNQGRDTSRIGGGIVDVLEQSVAKGCFDWLVQLYCVFYDEPHFGAVMGQGKATEYVTLTSAQIDRQLIVGVAPNSMRPKDEISKMNQATQLFEMKAIGPKTLLEALDFPNPDDAAGDGVLYAIDPQAYLSMNFPELMAKLQQFQQQAAAAQQQQQQQQMQMEQQSGQAELAHGEQAHAMKMRQGEESHQAKLRQSTEAASAKLAQSTANAIPK